MKMGNTSQYHHIFSPSCFSRLSLLYAAAIIPFLVFTIFLSDKFSPLLLTIPILILSTIFLITITKKKVIAEEIPVQEEPPKKNLLETMPENEASQKIELFDFTSDSESSEDDDDSVTSENIELNWVSPNNVEVSSDDSVSDGEDGLIEISLPNQNPVCLDEVEKEKLQENFPDFLPESIFWQHGLMEEVMAEISEVNEEENLIEIDISMGSIK